MTLYVVPNRPDNRHRRRRKPVRYRLRIDIGDAQPAIWRTLDVRSDVSLAELHLIVQAAYEWDDAHLFRFSLGAPFARTSQLFLCPFDAENGDPMSQGLPAADVTLDEVITAPDDVLNYVYDYGDSWRLTIVLTAVSPLADDQRAALVDGANAAPPEDCGHRVTAEELAEILDDTRLFNREAIERGLLTAARRTASAVFSPTAARLTARLSNTPQGPELDARLDRAQQLGLDDPADSTLAIVLRPYIWFLNRALDDGLELFPRGYLIDEIVAGAREVVPGAAQFVGRGDREIDVYPVQNFRVLLQDLKLIRKFKGRFVLTRAGKKAQTSPAALWKYLRESILDDSTSDTLDASALIALYVGTSEGEPADYEMVTVALHRLGWKSITGGPLGPAETAFVRAARTLAAIGDFAPTMTWDDPRLVSPEAAVLARQALSRE